MEQAVGGAGASEIESVFHLFSLGGLSGAIVIAKSHDTLHTWPEIGYAAIEAFACGDLCLPKRVEGAIIDFFAARRYIGNLRGPGLARSVTRVGRVVLMSPCPS